MTSIAVPPAVPAAPRLAARSARPRLEAARGQGQWARGHREPLNPNERMKKDDDGLNCRLRIENVYRYTGFDGIDP